MKDGLKPRTLAATFAAVAALGYLIQRLLNDQYGRMPFAGLLGLVLLVLIGGTLLGLGWPIRRWHRGTLTRPLDGLTAFRTLILARAAALVGAVVGGWELAHAAVLAPDADSARVQAGLLYSLAHVLVGAALVVLGLRVQEWARLDPPTDDDAV